MHYLKALIFFTLLYSTESFSYESIKHIVEHTILKKSDEKFGLINDNYNSYRFKKIGLCSEPILKDLELKKNKASITYLCANKIQRASLNIGKRSNVLVATKPIKKNSEITPQNAAFQITAIKKYQKPDLTYKIKAKRDINQAETISNTNTAPLEDILIGESLLIESSGDGFKIKRKMVALENGFVGDKIKIKGFKTHEGIVILKNGKISVKIVN